MDRVYRLYRRMHTSRSRVIRKVVHGYLRAVYACDIMPDTRIGEGTRFPHNGLGVVVHPSAVIGERCTICQSVTIGGTGEEAVPRLANDVLIGANSVVLGGITIGDFARIRAGSVVIQDVPAHTVAVGDSARVLNVE